MTILSATIPQMSDQTLWLTVAGVGVVALYLILRPRKRKDALSRVPTFPLTRQRDVEEQMSNLIVELAAMARQITGQLDTRAAKLELLMKEADEKLAALDAANRSAAKLMSDPPCANPSNDIDPTEWAALSDAHPPAPEAPVETRHGDIYSLANEGHSSQEIARLLRRPAGEVELILALRRR